MINPGVVDNPSMYTESYLDAAAKHKWTPATFLHHTLRGKAKQYSGKYQTALLRDLKSRDDVVAVRSSKGGQAFVRREDAGKFSKGGATQNPGNVDHTAYEASKILNRLKISVPEDFHALSRGQVDGLLEEADNIGYKRPASASGSKARYFHAYLQRLASSKGR
jgi:hypothetical protein